MLELAVEQTGVGDGALNAGGDTGNTAVGFQALFNDTTTGNYNTAVGDQALASNTTGDNNTASGASALFSNSTGNDNTVVGSGGLFNNTTGNGNTAMGAEVLFSNTSGSDNAVLGFGALGLNTTGNNNVAIGSDALSNSTVGSENTALGDHALVNNVIGNGNTASGVFALANNTTGSFNIAIGKDAGGSIVTANNVIAIGHPGADISNTTWIDHIFGVNVLGGALSVVVSPSGQLGTVSSSGRFKKDIADMGKSSEAILSLRPVTFHYKNDANAVAQFGLIAEEVEKVDPDLIIRDKEGKPYSVRYEAVNAMLLNEFLKEHKKVEQQAQEIQEQRAIIAELQTAVAEQRKSFQLRVAEQQKQIEALTSGLQRVSTQLKLIGGRPQSVADR